MKTWIIALLLTILCTSCIPYRVIMNGQPNIGDQYLFPQYPLPASQNPYTLPTYTRSSGNEAGLYHFLRKHKSFAFLVIRQDTIITEYYLRPELKQTATDVFSLSKPFAATTVAVAIQEGYIENINDTLGKYISKLPEHYKHIRIIDLLNMRSGIKTTFWNTAQLYYSNYLNQTSGEAPMLHPSGEHYTYSNQATQLLITLLENSTKQNFMDYFFEKVWIPLQMEDNGNWSLDSKRHHTPRGFAGLSLTARDVAKLGLLYLHNGKLNHRQIIPASWTETTLSPSEKLRITPEMYYHMHWKILTPNEEFLAKGLLGQYLYINTKTNTVIVRLGFKESSANWIAFFRSLQ